MMLVQRESRKFIFFLFSWNLFAFLARLTSGVNVLNDIGFCGECYCIPSIGQACPGMELLPQVEFSNEFLNVLRAMTRNTTFSLNCDPYQSDDCNSDPPLEIGGACAVEILRPETSATTTCPDQYSYRLVTIESRDTLQENQLLTHEGACGLCSSLQDLSVFMTSPDLTSLEADCGSRIRVSFEDGVACYMDAGFSEACASIRGYKTLQSSSLCVDFCRTETAVSNTGRPPSCELDDCLLCDELVAGLTYKRFAGRTRRNSGLLSGHVHNCVEIAGITHQNPCAAIGEAHSPPKCQGRLSVCSQDSDCCSGRCEDRRCRISKLRLSLNYRGGANMSGNVDDLP